MKLEPVAWYIHPRDHKHGFISEDRNSAIVCEDTSDITPLYAIPEGYVLVPKGATPKMVEAGYTAITSEIEINGNCLYNVYKAMIEGEQ